MKFIKKLDNLFFYLLGKMKIYYVKVILKNSFNIGVKPQLKLSSRIDIWGKEGNISIGDFFSMEQNVSSKMSNFQHSYKLQFNY